MKAIRNELRILRRRLRAKLGQDIFVPIQVDAKKAKYGSDYGGYVIQPERLNEQSIVYSFGCGDDISFELEIIKRHRCMVFAFDPSPETKVYLDKLTLPKEFIFSGLALASAEGLMRFWPSPNKRINYSLIPKIVAGGASIDVPARRLSTIMKQNNHSKIDLLKMDIEGAKFEVIKDIIASTIPVEQMAIEFHYRHKEFLGSGVSLMKEALGLLESSGYKIFDVSIGGEEYSFVNTATKQNVA